MSFARKVLSGAVACAVAASMVPSLGFAQDGQAFSDIPQGSAVFAAAEYMRAKGIVQGTNGKFMPDNKLTRAEAAKILVATQVTAEQLAAVQSSVYADVQPGTWYMSYVELARELLKLDAPPKTTTFNPNRNVRKNEFVKMLMTAKKLDATSLFSDIKIPLSADVVDVTTWDYPYMRYAVASSMISPREDKFYPGEEITRGQMALLYYRLDMYLAGRRTQALLSQAETEIVYTLQMLDVKDIERARLAANRAIVSARGAFAAKPNEAIVKGALKTAEGFQLLVLAYDAGVKGELDKVVQHSKDAWNLAEKAKQFSPELETISSQMKTIAKSMADEARKLQEGGPPPAATQQ